MRKKTTTIALTTWKTTRMTTWKTTMRMRRRRAFDVPTSDGASDDEGKEDMSQDFKPGDRVRVTSERPIHGYQPGSTGIVRTGPTTDKSGKTYYGVSMDKDASEDATLFLADEIEANV